MSYKVLKTCLNSTSVALFLLFFQSAAGQPNWTELNAVLDSKQKVLGTNLVMMVWKRGDTIVYKREMGDFKIKMQSTIGDASKWLTTALVMEFIDEGKLSLDDKVSRWIPEFAKYGKNYISIRTCLSHMTGVTDKETFVKRFFKNPNKYSSLEEEVNSYASREIRANPTQDFWYGNIGLNIAARVLEVISKKRFDVLVKQKLFNPLTMRRSSFSTLDGGPVNPSGGAQTTPEDFMKFLVMLLNNGKFAGRQILTGESVGQMMEIQSKTEIIKFSPKETEGLNYTLGSWALEAKDGKSTAVASLGFDGTWPVIDLCHGYAFLIMTKEPVEEEKKEDYLNIKAIVDGQIGQSCP